LSILGANVYILSVNMYILGAKYILGDNIPDSKLTLNQRGNMTSKQR